jgi:hypothetical protein
VSDPNGRPAPRRAIQLLITGEITPDGRVGDINVQGPVHDHFLCYGLLGGALEWLVRHSLTGPPDTPRIVPATVVPRPAPPRP